MSQQKKRVEFETSGNVGAALVHRYAGAVRRYFSRRLARIHDTEDLAQEVYLRLLRIENTTRIQRPLNFVYGMARHVLLDHRADSARREDILDSASDSKPDQCDYSHGLADCPEDQAIIQQQLEDILDKLPPLFSAILLLHDRDGRSYEEVAATLGISVHTVKKYITEARARARMSLWEY